MKICCITDQHFGVRNDNQIFHSYYKKFYDTVFFPFLKKNQIDTIVMLGDTFDRRKYIQYISLGKSRDYYFDKLRDAGITAHMIVGNHDIPFRESLKYNSPELLLKEYDNLIPYSKPTEVDFDGTKIMIIPWICAENEEEIRQKVKDTKAQILFGHLELAGFQMYKGQIATDHGTDPSMFDKFDLVCSGHYHHKSSRGNIHYLGAPYQMTWSDFNDPRGFHVFDTSDRSLVYHENPLKIFEKIYYNDKDLTKEQVFEYDFASLKDMYVKVIVVNKTNPYWFDLFIDKIDRAGVSNLQVVEDHKHLDQLDENHVDSETQQDTVTIINQCIEQMGVEPELKINLENTMKQLYAAAMEVDQI